jgi:hypothetical protein
VPIIPASRWRIKIDNNTKYDGKYCTTCEDDCKLVDSCPKRNILILPYAERIKIMGDVLREKYNPSLEPYKP